MINTTLKALRSCGFSEAALQKLHSRLALAGPEVEFPLAALLDKGRDEDVIWALVHGGPDLRALAVQFAADCAEHVLPAWTQKFPTDDRPQLAIQAVRSRAGVDALERAARAASAASSQASVPGCCEAQAAEAAAVAAAAASFNVPPRIPRLSEPAIIHAVLGVAAYGRAAAGREWLAEQAWQCEHLRKLLEEDE